MYIAVDIGGTKTLIATFSHSGEIVEQIKFKTPLDYEQFKTELTTAADQLTTKEFSAGGIGIRGNIDRTAGLSLRDDVLPWGQVPIRDDCDSIFNCQFVLENDSKLAGLSEAKLMADRYSKVLYITISTGIGSAFVVDGILDQNTIDSEIGKALYEHEGQIQPWEDFASGKAIVAKYNQLASEITDPMAWESISKNLAIGIIDASAAYTPDLIVLGGGVGSNYEAKFKQPLEQVILELTPAEIKVPPIVQAQHPEQAVIYGCYELAKSLNGQAA